MLNVVEQWRSTPAQKVHEAYHSRTCKGKTNRLLMTSVAWQNPFGGHCSGHLMFAEPSSRGQSATPNDWHEHTDSHLMMENAALLQHRTTTRRTLYPTFGCGICCFIMACMTGHQARCGGGGGGGGEPHRRKNTEYTPEIAYYNIDPTNTLHFVSIQFWILSWRSYSGLAASIAVDASH